MDVSNRPTDADYRRMAGLPTVSGEDRTLRINPGAAPGPVENPSIHPYPEPLALDEAKHRAEAVVYASFLRQGTPVPGAHAFYSVTLPFTPTKRREADFLAVCPQGIALVEVKGGIVDVNSVAGQGVYWKQYRLDGTPVDKNVSAAQIFTTTETLLATLREEAGIVVRNVAQIFVFPDTPRAIVKDPRVLAQNDSPARDFPRIAFKEDLERFGMWAIVAHELSLPGRTTTLALDVRQDIATWAVENTRVEPRDLPETAAEDPPAFVQAQPPARGAEFEGRNEASFGRPIPFDNRDARPAWDPLFADPVETVSAPVAKANRRWPVLIAIAAVILGIAAFLGMRAAPPVPPAHVPVTSPPLIPVPDTPPARPATTGALPAPAAVQTAAAGNTGIVPPHLNPSPVPKPAAPAVPAAADAFQAALSRGAAMPPETRIAAGGDWLRFLGPVAGRPGCHMVEMNRAGRTDLRQACIAVNGVWKY